MIKSTKTSLFNLLKKALDIYDIISLYDFDAFMESPQDIFADIGSEDLTSLMSLIGQEVDLIKNSPLFAGQTNTPVKGLLTYLAHELPDYLDTSTLLAVGSWQTEFEGLSDSLIGLKDSGVLDLLINGNSSPDMQTIIDMLLEPVSTELYANTYLKEILEPIVSSTITKKLIVYGLNQANSAIGDSIPELTLTTFAIADLTQAQSNDLVTIAENIAKCFTIINEEINLETISTESITKLANLLTALKNNAFRIGAGTGIEKMNSDVDLVNKKVNGGGIFSNYYISLISYVLGDNTAINYKSINWLAFFTAAKNLGSNLNDLGGEGSDISDIIDFGDPAIAEDLKNLLDAIGLDGSIADDIVTIKETIDDLMSETGTLTDEKAFELINEALLNIINSSDEEGNSTIDTIIDIVKMATGTDVSGTISNAVLASEQTVNYRLYLLTNNYSIINPLSYTSTTLDTVHTNMTVFAASIQDLTCGATFMLNQAIDSGLKVYITNIDSSTLSTIIDNATSDETVRNLVKSLFEIIQEENGV
jgi:hypothetical protein